MMESVAIASSYQPSNSSHSHGISAPYPPVMMEPLPDSDMCRKDAIRNQIINTDSSLKDYLVDDPSGSLFDSISWLLMNSGSLDFSEAPDTSMFVSMKASSDALEQSLLSSSMHAYINQDIGISNNWNSFSFDQLARGEFSSSMMAPPTAAPFAREITVSRNDMIEDDDDSSSSDTDAAIKSSSRKRGASGDSKGDEAPKKKRQREKIQDLEDKAKMLMAENAELRTHLTDLSTRAVDMERQKTEMLNTMSEKVARGDTGSPELVGMLRRYGELFAEYGACRQKEVSFHLSQLKRLMLPTQTTKMCMWTLQQDKSFYQSSTSPLWNILSGELGLAPEQALKIQTHRYAVCFSCICVLFMS
jgi:hypothetical protein